MVMFDELIIAAKAEKPLVGSGRAAVRLMAERLAGIVDIATYSFDRKLAPEFEVSRPPEPSREAVKATYDLVGIYDLVYLAARRHVVRVLDVEVRPREGGLNITVHVSPTGGIFFGWRRTRKKFVRMIGEGVRSRLGVTPIIEIVEVVQ